jgi:hypothetical protein
MIPSTLLYLGASLALAAGGWVWFFSRQAAMMTELLRRVTAVEVVQQARDEKLSSVVDRLARMEPMLELLVRSVLVDREPSSR